MLRTLLLLTLVVGAFVAVASESPERRRELLDRSATLVEKAVAQVRTGGAALVQNARGSAGGDAAERLRHLRDQGIVTEEFVARRGGAAPSAPAASPAPTPAAPTPPTGREVPRWSDAEYEGAKQRLLDALRRLEGRGHAD